MGLTARLRNHWIPWTAVMVATTALYAIAVGLTGGFKVAVGGVRLSSRSWGRPAVAAAIGAIALLIARRQRIVPALRRVVILAHSIADARYAAGAAMIW